MFKRLLSYFLTLTLVITCISWPVEANAEDTTETIDGITYTITDWGCITNITPNVAEIDIPEKINDIYVKSISSTVFRSHSKLEKLYIPAGVSGDWWWQYLKESSKLNELVVDEDNKYYKSVDGILYSKDGKSLICYPCGITELTYDMPESVENIYDSAFIENKHIKTVNISSNVTKISSNCFYGCSNLQVVNFPSNLYLVGSCSFQSCYSLNSIKIPEGVQYIDSSAFSGCSNLRNVELSSTIEKIPQSCFQNCLSLQSITIPEGVNIVSDGAFYGCTSLENIVLPSSLNTIGQSCFMYCSKIESINIPDNVSSIGSRAFYNCTALKTIDLPYSLQEISKEVFWSCQALTNIEIPDNVTSIGSNALYNCTSIGSVIIPDSVTSIEGKLLEYSPNAVIKCGENSYARQYAIDNGYTYELVDSDKKQQHITGVTDYIKYLSDSSFMITPVNDGDGALSYETDSPCVNLTQTDDGVRVDLVSAGTATITIKAAGTAEYVSAEKKVKVTVKKNIQEITCDDEIEKTYGDSDFIIPVEMKGEAPLSYSVNGDSISVAEDGTVSLLKSGESTVTVTSEETDCYQTTSKTVRIKVDKDAQRIECKDTFNMSEGSSSFYLGVKTYGNGEVSYSSSSDCISVSDEGEVSINSAGTAEITVKMAETDQYYECTKVISINIEGHNHTAKEAAKENYIEPGCETAGSYDLVVRCAECGEKLDSEHHETEALGHNIVTDEAVKATYISTGLTEGSHCSRCGKVITAQKTIPRLELSKVSNVSAKLKTYRSVKLTWSKVKGATGYYVMYRKGSSGSWTVKKTTHLYYNTANLKSGYSYQFKVRAYAKNSKGEVVNKGDSSTVKTCRTLKKMKTPVVQKVSSKAVKVKWSTLSGATGYQVAVTAKSNGKTVKGYASGSYKKLSPVTAGNRYSFKVRAYKTVDGKKIYGPWSDLRTYTHK